MDKKAFNRITKQIFLEYGFTKDKEQYVLTLPEITIFVKFRSWRGIKSFNYWFYLNELYDEQTPLEELSDSRVEIKMEHSPSLEGYHNHEILFEEYTEYEYRSLLNKLLHSYFDPYKENALQYLKDNYRHLYLSEKARIFLDLIDYKKGKEIFFEGGGKIPLARFDEYRKLGIPKQKETEWKAELEKLNNKNSNNHI